MVKEIARKISWRSHIGKGQCYFQGRGKNFSAGPPDGGKDKRPAGEGLMGKRKGGGERRIEGRRERAEGEGVGECGGGCGGGGREGGAGGGRKGQGLRERVGGEGEDGEG